MTKGAANRLLPSQPPLPWVLSVRSSEHSVAPGQSLLLAHSTACFVRAAEAQSVRLPRLRRTGHRGALRREAMAAAEAGPPISPLIPYHSTDPTLSVR